MKIKINWYKDDSRKNKTNNLFLQVNKMNPKNVHEQDKYFSQPWNRMPVLILWLLFSPLKIPFSITSIYFILGGAFMGLVFLLQCLSFKNLEFSFLFLVFNGIFFLLLFPRLLSLFFLWLSTLHFQDLFYFWFRD